MNFSITNVFWGTVGVYAIMRVMNYMGASREVDRTEMGPPKEMRDQAVEQKGVAVKPNGPYVSS